jgi:hypothetical protein
MSSNLQTIWVGGLTMMWVALTQRKLVVNNAHITDAKFIEVLRFVLLEDDARAF